MESRLLGRTQLLVSRLAMGTVELGMDYGIRAPGDFGRPPEADAVRMVNAAADGGINMFDTARSYGTSEDILGKALGTRADCYVCTKVLLPQGGEQGVHGATIEHDVKQSLEQSRRALQRSVLDLVHLHNATASTFCDGAALETLRRARERGEIRFIGASVYSEDAALAAIDSGDIDVVEIAFSLLDQRAAARVLPAARDARVGIMARSVLLQGVLTPKAHFLPPRLDPLREAADRLRKTFDIPWEKLPQLAIRFCMAVPQIDVVILGIRTYAELKQAISAAEQGPLSKSEMELIPTRPVEADNLLNPSFWGDL